jgi:hypothetical protein
MDAVSARIGQNNVVGSLRIVPVYRLRTNRQKPSNLGIPIIGIEIQMVSLVIMRIRGNHCDRHLLAVARPRNKDGPIVGWLPKRSVVQCRAPEFDGAWNVAHTPDDGPDVQHD